MTKEDFNSIKMLELIARCRADYADLPQEQFMNVWASIIYEWSMRHNENPLKTANELMKLVERIM